MVAIGPERPERKTAAFKENGNWVAELEYETLASYLWKTFGLTFGILKQAW
jgi:hypothetical protein